MNFDTFLSALEERHFADLRFSDVTRALRALSSAYVERRETALANHKALDGAGKRAAFALYYGPLHFLLVRHILREINATFEPGTIVDLGCGTGVAGASVAEHMRAVGHERVRMLGIDTHPWVMDEARFTYKGFDLPADVRRGDAAGVRLPSDTSVVVAAFVVNELTDKDRNKLLANLFEKRAADAQTRHVLIIEPISQRISPWWDEWAAEFIRRGGRADVWKARVEPPPLIKQLAKAAGLRPEMMTARSLFV